MSMHTKQHTFWEKKNARAPLVGYGISVICFELERDTFYVMDVSTSARRFPTIAKRGQQFKNEYY